MAYLKQRIRDADIGKTAGENGRDRVQVHLVDYRDMPAEWEGTFDRVVCVEMVENVGVEYLEVHAVI